MAANAVRRGAHLAQVGFTLGAGRSADAHERELGVLEPIVVIQREAKATGLEVLDDDLFQARLVDRQLTLPKPLHFARINVNADDLVAQLRKASRGDEPNIVGADDYDIGHFRPN